MAAFQTPANWNVSSTHTVFQISSNDTTAIITTFGITNVRNVITALFVVLNFLLAFTGGEYVKSKARRRLAIGETVPVPELTSWLGLSDMAKYTWSLRLLPGGWLGWLMIFTGAVGVLHQFLTNTLVTPTLVPTRCIFDYRCVPPSGTSFSPAANDENVFRSQLASLTNGGTRGIYKRFFADNEIQMFRPGPSDIYGAWHCANIKNDTVPWTGHASFYPPAAGITLDDMSLYFNSTAYLFKNGSVGTNANSVTNVDTEVEYIQSFFIWSTAGPKDMSFVRASIMNLQLFVDKTVEAMDFECALTLDQPVPQMDVPSVLQTWASQAWSYQSSRDILRDTTLWLELALDAITTESLWNDNINPTNIEPAESIGCVVEGTRVSVGILGILGLITLIFLSLLGAKLWVLLASVQLSGKNRARDLPFDLADWQLAAYYQGQRQATLTRQELRTIEFQYEKSKDKLCMITYSTGPAQFTEYELRNSGFVEYDHASKGSHPVLQRPIIQPYMQLLSTPDLRYP